MLKISEMPDMKPIPLGGDQDFPWWKNFKSWQLNSRRFLVTQDWYYTLPDGTRIVIPKGFIFDGASVPRFLWPILDPFGILLIAGLIHDFCYRYNFLLNASFKPIHISMGQKFADDLFRDVAKKCNGLFVPNSAAWGSLRVFGRIAWKNGRNKNAKVYWDLPREQLVSMWDDLMNASTTDMYLRRGISRVEFLNNCEGRFVGA